jgi:hypothetical protein
MLYLHDVWVNWFEGEENGYNVCHFHEWRKSDSVDLLDQTPLLKLEKPLFHYIENDLGELPEVLLNDVFQKSYVRKNHERLQQDYCFIATDGDGIIAVDTLGYDIPIRKSRLIPRQEQLVFDMVKEIEPESYTFTPSDQKEYHILSPEPDLMKGLTRKERQLKQLLFMALDQLHSSQNTAEIRYWFTEWSPYNYESIQDMGFQEAFQNLFEEVKSGWTKKHEQLCEGLIKGQPFFERLWENEQATKVN